MSLSERTDSTASHFRDNLSSILAKARHKEIWGINLQNGERHSIEIILDKVLKIPR